MFNNTFALLAALFMGLSYATSTFELLIVGRFLAGVNAGIRSLTHRSDDVEVNMWAFYTSGMNLWNIFIWKQIVQFNEMSQLILDTCNSIHLIDRYRDLCAASVSRRDGTQSPAWFHGNGNIHFYHRGDPDRTSHWPQVSKANNMRLLFFHWVLQCSEFS